VVLDLHGEALLVVFGGDGVLDEVQECTAMTTVCGVGALASCNDGRRWLELASLWVSSRREGDRPGGGDLGCGVPIGGSGHRGASGGEAG
jgi:hypothetical protein